MSTKGVRAAIDCGSNTTRLLVVDANGTAKARDMRTTRLGSGVDTSRRLDPTAVQRTLDAFESFKETMDSAGVSSFRAVATSAVRDASNSNEFLERAEQALGQSLEIIDGESEAALSYAGAIQGRPAGKYMLIDIGGGSTEVVVGDESKVDQAISLDLGCVRTTEQIPESRPLDLGQLTEQLDAVASALAPARTELGSSFGASVVGVAGTITTLAAIKGGVVEYHPGAVEGDSLDSNWVANTLSDFADASTEQLRVWRGMPPDRAEVILGGTVILTAFMGVFCCESLTVSERGILDGVIRSLRR